MATTTATQIQQLYVGLLGRAADQGGLNWWVDQVTTGGRTLEDIRASFVTSTEYTTTYGAATTRTDLVTAIYSNLFERTPSADELAYWVSTDTRPADQLVTAFLEFASTADQAVINNKTFVAQTYTDTAGTSFNAAASASVIANVDGTAASVSTAISAIANGTVAGLTPGAALIANVTAATAAITDLQKASFVTNPTFDGTADSNTIGGTNPKDGLVTALEAQDVQFAAQAARNLITGTTTELTTAANTANTNLNSAKVLVATAGATAAQNTYDNAVAAQKVLVGTTVGTPAVGVPADGAGYVPAKTAAEVAAANAASNADVALNAIDAALGVSGAATSYAKLKAAFGVAAADTFGKAELESALQSVNGTATKTALIAELQKLPTFGQAGIDAVNKETAIVAANQAVTDAKTVALTTTTGYVAAAEAAASATDALTKATTADAAIAVAKVVVDKFAALDTTLSTSTQALEIFKAANNDKVAILDVTSNTTTAVTSATAAKSDVFYFTKVNAASDFNIGGTTASTFGTGDSIVLGSGYTFNSGALSTGNATAMEVFFVKGATGTQVVIETNAVGSATTVAGVDGTVTESPNTAVINLVGVTADHLSFNNGVVSYV